jgi:hypothetical protein
MIMASSRQASGNRRKSASTGLMKHKHKVVRKPSAEKAGGSDRREPYPVKQTRK